MIQRDDVEDHGGRVVLGAFESNGEDLVAVGVGEVVNLCNY
jgi:hypothetical protein